MGSNELPSKTPLQEQTTDDEALFALAMQMGCTTAVSMTLKAAIELDVLEIIAFAGPGAWLSPAEIVSRMPTAGPDAADVLDRMLRFLASHGLLKCEVEAAEDGRSRRRYALGPVCKFLTKDKDGMSTAPLVLMNQDRVLVETWHCLKYAVLEGAVPFAKAHGVTAFEYHGKDRRFNELFNNAMFNQTTMLIKKILEKYKGFDGLRVLVDVGGGLGATLNMIVSKYPTIKGINFDLPCVVCEAPSIAGVEHVGGDMFVGVPNGDAIFMKWILHDWSDKHCVKILKNCLKALPNKGKVIVVEGILPETPDAVKPGENLFLGDLCMLAYNVGGKERTQKEYEYLAKESGCSGFKVVSSAYGFSVMEFCK